MPKAGARRCHGESSHGGSSAGLTLGRSAVRALSAVGVGGFPCSDLVVSAHGAECDRWDARARARHSGHRQRRHPHLARRSGAPRAQWLRRVDGRTRSAHQAVGLPRDRRRPRLSIERRATPGSPASIPGCVAPATVPHRRRLQTRAPGHRHAPPRWPRSAPAGWSARRYP